MEHTKVSAIRNRVIRMYIQEGVYSSNLVTDNKIIHFLLAEQYGHIHVTKFILVLQCDPEKKILFS